MALILPSQLNLHLTFEGTVSSDWNEPKYCTRGVVNNVCAEGLTTREWLGFIISLKVTSKERPTL